MAAITSWIELSCRSRQSKRDMHDLIDMSGREAEATPLENIHHPRILGQNLCDELLQPGEASEPDEMAHERCAEAFALVFVDDGKGDLGLPRFHDNIARAADDRASFRLP